MELAWDNVISAPLDLLYSTAIILKLALSEDLFGQHGRIVVSTVASH